MKDQARPRKGNKGKNRKKSAAAGCLGWGWGEGVAWDGREGRFEACDVQIESRAVFGRRKG